MLGASKLAFTVFPSSSAGVRTAPGERLNVPEGTDTEHRSVPRSATMSTGADTTVTHSEGVD